MFNPKACIDAAKGMLNREYKFGAKWDQKDYSPPGPTDCSNFVRWALSQGGATSCPDGSWNQYLDSYDIRNPAPGDLKFLGDIDNGGRMLSTHHVVMLQDEDTVIEARGEPYNRVINRPRAAWDAQKGTSKWRRPKSIDRANQEGRNDSADTSTASRVTGGNDDLEGNAGSDVQKAEPGVG